MKRMSELGTSGFVHSFWIGSMHKSNHFINCPIDSDYFPTDLAYYIRVCFVKHGTYSDTINGEMIKMSKTFHNI